MKLFSLKEMGTGQVVRKEIQCAFTFVWKIMFSFTLLNIVLFLPNKSSTSSYCPNALLNLHFWPLFGNLLLLLPPPNHCSLKLLLLSCCPLTPWLASPVPWSLNGLLTVLGSCNILPVDRLALVASVLVEAASAVNHATIPVLLLLMQ